MIYVVLPPQEGFGLNKHGAISLCVLDSSLRTSHNVTVVGEQDPSQAFLDVSVLQVVAYKRWYRSRLNDYGRKLRYLFNSKKDAKIIEIHNRPSLVKYLYILDVPLVLFLHNNSLSGAKTIAERKYLLSKCTAIFCVSRFVRDSFLDGLEPSSKVHVIYNGYEPDQKLMDVEKEKRILFVGRLAYEKGALELAKALEEILLLFPDWRADFVIPHSFTKKNVKSNSYQTNTYEILRKLEPKVKIHSFLSHLRVEELFSRASIVATPANWDEPFGRTSLEAMAYGCALVSTRRGGLAEFVDESCAMLINKVTPEEIFHSLVKLIEDNSLREKLQQMAKVRAREFRLEKPVVKLDNLRLSILSSSKQG